MPCSPEHWAGWPKLIGGHSRLQKDKFYKFPNNFYYFAVLTHIFPSSNYKPRICTLPSTKCTSHQPRFLSQALESLKKAVNSSEQELKVVRILDQRLHLGDQLPGTDCMSALYILPEETRGDTRNSPESRRSTRISVFQTK